LIAHSAPPQERDLSIIGTPSTDLDAAPEPTSEQIDAMTPLHERLRLILDTIPAGVKRQGLTLESLRERLAGRWRGKAHPGEIGRALTRLGYERYRDWSVGASYGARWYPRGYGPKNGYHSRQQLREERPDLFPARVGRAPKWLIEERRKAADDLQQPT
jgi:hypothetical protein